MNTFTFLLSCTLLFLSPLSAKGIHLLILGDTKDDTIGMASRKNIQNIKQSFSYLASVGQLPFFLTELTTHNDNLTREDITRWIRKEPIASDDIIVLHYSGHGGREQGSTTLWPSGDFPQRKRKGFIVEFDEIMDRLFSKKAAFYLVLLDCCNVLVQKDLRSDQERPTNQNPPTFDFERLNKQIHAAAIPKLFSKRYGLVIASAAAPTEVGWCNPSKIDMDPWSDPHLDRTT
jgi:hypothetical protein